jgi:hypothetical protein
MHSRAIAILDQLEKASWFSRVGINEGSAIVVVTRWPDAIEQCSSFEWEDLRLHVLNQYRECIACRSEERWQFWNGVVDEAKGLIGPLVDRKIAEVVREHDLPEIFKIGFAMISPVLAWKLNTRTCARPASSRALASGTSTDTFPAAGGARFPRGSS